MAYPRIAVSQAPIYHVVNGITQFIEHRMVTSVTPNIGEDSVDCINRLLATFPAGQVLINGLPIGANGERAEQGGAPSYGSPT